MAINAIGNGIPFPRGEGIPSAVKDSMVLWYDIKRQCATNESMADNPKLIDLSGNGHDATCYNFAWNVDSGIQNEQVTFADFGDNGTLKTIYSNTIHGSGVLKYYRDFTNNVDSFKIKITNYNANILSGVRYYYRQPNGIQLNLTFTDNGTYTLPINYTTVESDSGAQAGFVVLRNDNNETLDNSIVLCTIEILPLEYPNALVFDGVDDYARVDDITLTDYTVIAKRKILEDIDNNETAKGVFSKRYRTYSGEGIFEDESGAFVIEKLKDITSNKERNYNYGFSNSINLRKNTDIIYQTKTSYCGDTIRFGDKKDTNYLLLGCGLFSDYNASNVSEYMNIVLYSFILFNKTLSTKDINWVKRNLIEGDTEL